MWTNDPAVDAIIQRNYSDPTIHSVLCVTWGEVFDRVWNRIQKSSHRNDLIQRLKEEMIESNGMCFTGRFTRLVNVLSGFFDDIQLRISDEDQIVAKINLAKQQAMNETMDQPERMNHVWLQKTTKFLQELALSEEQIEVWTHPIKAVLKS